MCTVESHVLDTNARVLGRCKLDGEMNALDVDASPPTAAEVAAVMMVTNVT